MQVFKFEVDEARSLLIHLFSRNFQMHLKSSFILLALIQSSLFILVGTNINNKICHKIERQSLYSDSAFDDQLCLT